MSRKRPSFNPRARQPFNGHQHREAGMTLIIGLLLLLVITIIGVAASSQTVTTSKIVTNTKDKQLSFAAAETGLVQAGDQLDDPTKPPECTSAAGYLGLKLNDQNWWSDFVWESDGTTTTEAVLIPLDGARGTASYVIEEPRTGASPYTFQDKSYAPAQQFDYYKVTAKGKGPGQAETYLTGVYIIAKTTESLLCEGV